MGLPVNYYNVAMYVAGFILLYWMFAKFMTHKGYFDTVDVFEPRVDTIGAYMMRDIEPVIVKPLEVK